MHAILQVELIDLLSAAGCGTIEAASFVSPKWVPQMADGSDVLSKIRRAPGVKYAALTPNLRGLEGALEAGVDEVGALCEQMPCCAVVVVPAAVATGSLHMYFAVHSVPAADSSSAEVLRQSLAVHGKYRYHPSKAWGESRN